ncbi:MAG: GAF domain-containing protein, partial [Chloroflexota bacterium]
MPQLPLPPRETERLEALYRYEILDTPPEKALDDLVHLASYICRTPIAVVSLVDSDRQWFKSKIGLTATETSRYIAFCSHTILGPDLMIVPDALADERFADNPLVTGNPHVRFYCGAPLTTPEGFRIGTLSVIDHVPRTLTEEQLEALQVLSRQVIEHLMLNRSLKELSRAHSNLSQTHETLRQSEEKFRKLNESSPSAIFIYRNDLILYANAAAAFISGYPVEELLAMDMWKMVHPDFLPLLKARALAAQEGATAPARYEFKIIRKDGQERWLDFTATTIDYGGWPARLATGYDVTERKRGEESLKIQSRILELIAVGTPLRESLDTLARSIEAQSNGMHASILLLDADGVHVRCIAAPSLPESFIQAIDGQPIGPCAGSCGTAAFQGEVVIVEDIATDPLWEHYRDFALPHGLRACWSTPIFDRQRRVLGTFALYFRTPGRPTARHMRLVGMATHTAAIAIERQQAEAALRRNGEQLQQALADASDRERLLQAIFDS